MENGRCYGVWSEALVDELARVRPDMFYTELSPSFGSIVYGKDGRMMIAPDKQQTRLASLKLGNYRLLATRLAIG